MIRIWQAGMMAAAALVIGCSSGAPLASTGGGVSVAITSATADSVGYALTLRVTNSDTGSIMLSAYCPGTIEVRARGEWTPAGDDPICPSVATSVDPGHSRILTLRHQGVTTGQVIRFVLQWSWLNGDRYAAAHVASAAVALK